MRTSSITAALVALLLVPGCMKTSTRPADSGTRSREAARHVTLLESGSFANATLAAETTSALLSIVGGDSVDDTPIQKFVMKAPTGEPGAREWMELWRMEAEGSKAKFTIRFAENGPAGASFEIFPGVRLAGSEGVGLTWVEQPPVTTATDLFEVLIGTWGGPMPETACGTNPGTFAFSSDRATMKITHASALQEGRQSYSYTVRDVREDSLLLDLRKADGAEEPWVLRLLEGNAKLVWERPDRPGKGWLVVRCASAANTPAFAQQADPSQQELFAGYTNSPVYKGMLEQIFNADEPAELKAECPTLKIVDFNKVTVVHPPTFVRAGANFNVDRGRWVAAATLDRCGTRVTRRALITAVPGANNVNSLRLLPGEFRGNLKLEADVSPVVSTGMMGAANCADRKQFQVLNVAALTPSTPQGWSERWTASACGKKVDADVTYTRASDGMDFAAGTIKVR